MQHSFLDPNGGRAFFSATRDSVAAATLASALERRQRSGVILNVGAAADVDPAAEVWIDGRPSPEALDRLPALRAVVIPFAGVPPETRSALSERPHLRVYNLHHNAEAVAEAALALYLAAAKAIVPMDASLRAGDWRPRYAPDPSRPLRGARAVVFGYGSIGRRLGGLLRGLGIEVTGVRRTGSGGEPGVVGPERWPGVLDGADALFVCAPLTALTRGVVDASALARLADHASVINVARAEIVEMDALFEELQSGRLRAALDVWRRYPRDAEERASLAPDERAFHSLENVVLSPHRTGHGPHVERARGEALAALLDALCAGAGPSPLDLERGY